MVALEAAGTIVLRVGSLIALVAIPIFLLAWLTEWATRAGRAATRPRLVGRDSRDARRIRVQRRRALWSVALVLVAATTVGAAAGYAGGMARDGGAVTAIVPAALALLGGIAIYVFGAVVDRSAIVALSVTSFAIALVMGFQVGALQRQGADALQQFAEACFGLFFAPETMNTEAIDIAKRENRAICEPVLNHLAGFFMRPPEAEVSPQSG